MIYTPVVLDKNRNVVLGFKAMKEFKNITGKSLTKFDFDDENVEIEEIVPIIFYVGLKHEDKELTVDKVIDLLDKYLGMAEAIKLMPQIFEDAFGKKEEVSKK